MEKKVRDLAERLKAVPELSEEERWLFAKTLSATPQERWEMHENFLRSLNLYSHWDRLKYGFKSPE